MRISDWSSDVCSSDPIVIPLIERGRAAGGFTFFARPSGGNADDRQRDSVAVPNMPEPCGERVFRHSISACYQSHRLTGCSGWYNTFPPRPGGGRYREIGKAACRERVLEYG